MIASSYQVELFIARCESGADAFRATFGSFWLWVGVSAGGAGAGGGAAATC